MAQRKRIQRIQWIHRARATATYNVFTTSKKSYILIFSSSSSGNSRSEIFRNKRICDHSEHDEWMCTFFYSYFVHLNICAIWMCKYNSWRVKIMTIKIVRCQIYPWQSVQIARCWILTLFISLQLFSGHWTLTITSFGTANKKHQRKIKNKIARVRRRERDILVATVKIEQWTFHRALLLPLSASDSCWMTIHAVDIAVSACVRVCVCVR